MKTAAFFVLSAWALASALPPAQELLQALEDNYKMGSDISASVTLTQQKTGQGTKIIDMQYYRRDADNSFMIVMTGPESDKGNGYLRVGDNFWMYRRNTRTFQHVNRDENIGGSDAKADDFETRNLTELYEGARDSAGNELLAEEMLGKIPVYRLEVKAKVKDVDYPKKIYWIQKSSRLLLKESAYALSGTLMQTAYYLKYTQVAGKYVPVRQLFIDEFEKGNKTIVDLANLVVKKLDDALFTKAYLENLSK